VVGGSSVNHEKKPSEIAPVYGISERWVQQLVKQYRETKKYPELKKNRNLIFCRTNNSINALLTKIPYLFILPLLYLKI